MRSPASDSRIDMTTPDTAHGGRAHLLTRYPVAVIGAGPIGLAAAAHLVERGIEVVVLEAGPSAGHSVRSWGHIRLFSPWEMLVDEAAARLLDTAHWESPEGRRLPMGRELVDDYLLPLADTAQLARRIRYGSVVTAVTRRGMDRTRTAGRAETPFVLRIDGPDGATELLAGAVIDCSGTTSSPNGLTASGLPPAGLVRSPRGRDAVTHALPDVLGSDRARFAGRHTLVVGAGHSAANTILGLVELARQEPGTSVAWAVRTASPTRVFGAGDDRLAARGRLGSIVHDLVDSGEVTLIDGFEIDDVTPAPGGGVTVSGRRRDAGLEVAADVVVGATGFRPQLDMLREIRLSLDEVVEAPRALAPLIDPNVHSCGSVPPHGVVELTHPEPGFYIAGMKSYGRAPTFLLATGYEQVRSIADELAGDHASARDVRLVLPETGVCSTGAAMPVDTAGVPAGVTLLPVVGGSGGCCA
jgi:flavin-dependent dehydrogenase